jgi:hypothetical protein
MTMHLLRTSSEDEMIAAFLRDEYASTERYGEDITRCLTRLGLPPRILVHPDLTDQAANDHRREILGCYRGYGQPGPSFFTGFPAGRVDWNWASVSRGELLATRFIRYWADIWDGSRSPRDLARRIRKGSVPDWARRDGTLERIHTLADAVAAGHLPPPIILVTADGGATKVAMEGSTRLTVFALVEDALPIEMTVLIGGSPDIAAWDEY